MGWLGCGGCSMTCTPLDTDPPRTRWNSRCSPSRPTPSSPDSGSPAVHTDQAPWACSRDCCGSCRADPGGRSCRSGDWWSLLAGREAQRRPLDLGRAAPLTRGATATCFLCRPGESQVAEVTDGSLADFRRRYHLEFRVPWPGK